MSVVLSLINLTNSKEFYFLEMLSRIVRLVGLPLRTNGSFGMQTSLYSSVPVER
jgi:hypothetical protein